MTALARMAGAMIEQAKRSHPASWRAAIVVAVPIVLLLVLVNVVTLLAIHAVTLALRERA
jgi:hypothetical protein